MKDHIPVGRAGHVLAGKYRVERVLGEGGMGVVVAATHLALGQRVAIKFLRPGALANAKAVGRFEREARPRRACAASTSRACSTSARSTTAAPTWSWSTSRAATSATSSSRAVLPVGDAVDYVLQACEAIAEAHAPGIVHRDLKPANLFLRRRVDGAPAREGPRLRHLEGRGRAAEDMSLTRTTEIIGSPIYMSPEQLRASKDVDVRTDIWALGVILYELLTEKAAVPGGRP